MKKIRCMAVWMFGCREKTNKNARQKHQNNISTNTTGLMGFTLTEVVIAIVLVVLLSTISTPIYKNYVKNAKLAEGYALLATIRSAQENYFNENGFHAYDQGVATSNDTILGINARLNKYYTKFKSKGHLGIQGTVHDNMIAGFSATAISIDYHAAPQLIMHYNRDSGITISTWDWPIS